MATVAEFLSVIKNSSPQVHIFHNQTTKFAEHMAISGYYDDVLDIVDRLTETYSGLYGNVVGYQAQNYKDWSSTADTLAYFQSLYQYVQANRNIFKESFLQNIIDELSEMLSQTIYKLKLQ